MGNFKVVLNEGIASGHLKMMIESTGSSFDDRVARAENAAEGRAVRSRAIRIEWVGWTARFIAIRSRVAARERDQKIRKRLISEASLRKTREEPVPGTALDFAAEADRVLSMSPGNLIGRFPLRD